MILNDEEKRFLLILADGRKKTYVHISQGFGQPLTPLSPQFTNAIAKSLLKRKLIRRAGGGYRITEAGLEALRLSGLSS